MPPPDQQVAPILKAHQDNLTNKIPSFLKEATPELPTAIFDDYVKTGNPIFKQKTAHALDSLTSFVKAIPSAVNSSKSFLLGESNYQRPTRDIGDVNPSILDRIQQTENSRNDPNAIVHNKDGSKDYGLMQINSSMFPFVKQHFKNLGRVFNPLHPDDSRLAAQAILQDNSSRFKKAVGRPPNDPELISSYNVGITQAIKEAKQKMQGKQSDKYVKASIFHG